MKNTLYITLFLALLVGSFFLGRRYASDTVITQTDTLTVTRTDTIKITKVKEVKRRVVDTILVPVKDTILINDTTFIQLPREQKIYQNDNYKAWVSGYKPRLDSIETYQKTIERIVTQTRKSNSGWGIMGGVSMTPQGLQPSITVGYYIRIK